MAKPRPACSASAKQSCNGSSCPEKPKSVPALKNSDYVIALHGRFTPHTHSKIFAMVDELGARHENFSQHIAECTHLITTESEVNARCLSFKVKIAALKNCKIVNINWLFKSLTQGYPISVAGFELQSKELDRLKRQGLESLKRIWEDDKEEIPLAKLTKIKPAVYGFFADLVDEQFPGPKKGLLVWKYPENVYDATMVKVVPKESSAKPADQTRSVILRRQQLLHDSHMNEYHTWSYERVAGVISEANRAGLGDLESAKRAFEKLFNDSTGNTWDDRHKKSNPSKFTFVECHFMDEELSLQRPNQDKATSKVNEVIDLITGQIGGSKSFVKKLVPLKGTQQTEVPVTPSKHQLRVCLAILKQLLAHSDFTKEKATRGKTVTTLIECYQALVTSPELSTSVDLEWLKDEYDHLSYQRIISWAPQQEVSCPGWTSTHLAQHAYRALGLRTMRLVDPSTIEHKLLSNYFRFSAGGSPYYPVPARSSITLINIFRIERLQEAKRYQKWIQNHDGRRRLLWHGSPNKSFTGILSQGLRGNIGEPGVFAAELAGVSTAYSQKNWNQLRGGGRTFLMLLCEVSIEKAADTSKARYRDAKCIHPDLEGVQMLDIAIGEIHNFDAPKMAIPPEHRMPVADQVRMRYLFQWTI